MQPGSFPKRERGVRREVEAVNPSETTPVAGYLSISGQEETPSCGGDVAQFSPLDLRSLLPSPSQHPHDLFLHISEADLNTFLLCGEASTVEDLQDCTPQQSGDEHSPPDALPPPPPPSVPPQNPPTSSLPETLKALCQPLLVQVAEAKEKPRDLCDRLAALVGSIETPPPDLPRFSLVPQTERPKGRKRGCDQGDRLLGKRGRLGEFRGRALAQEQGQEQSQRRGGPLGEPLVELLMSSWPRGGRVPDGVVLRQVEALAEAVAVGEEGRIRLLFSRVVGASGGRASPTQRLALHVASALALRMAGGGARAHSAPLRSSPIEAKRTMATCGDRMPHITFSMTAGTLGLVEALVGERRCHLVDLGMWHLGSWPTVLRHLASQKGGPPSVRMTAVVAPWHGNDYKKALLQSPEAMGAELAALAAELAMPFEFSTVLCSLDDFKPDLLAVQPGEAVAVLCVMRMKNLFDGTVVRYSPRDKLMLRLRQLSPKVVITVELDADLNLPFFLGRIREALSFYLPFFEVSALTLPDPHCPVRYSFENDYLYRDIVNVVACEGTERRVRSESLVTWTDRCLKLGFRGRPFSPSSVRELSSMLRRFPPGFQLREAMGAGLQLLWGGRPMVYASSLRA